MARLITAFSNPLVKAARSLRDKKNRKREGLFLAEGLRILTEAREADILPEQLFYSDSSHPLVRQLIDRTEAAGGITVETNADILHKISGKENPQAIIGIYRAPDTSLVSLDREQAPLWIVAQALRDPGNIGTIMRTGDAVGAGGLILVDDCADPFSVEAVRASMGAIFTQRVATSAWTDFIAWLRSGPGQLIGTSLDTEQDYQSASYQRPAFILIGNEQAGLPSEYERECDQLVKIPMLGKADSLNAAVAMAVMAYEVINQWRRRNDWNS